MDKGFPLESNNINCLGGIKWYLVFDRDSFKVDLKNKRMLKLA